MTLGDYLLATGQTTSGFGELIEKSQSTVSKYARGALIPDRNTMTKIFEVTAGQVTPNDFYDLELKRAS